MMSFQLEFGPLIFGLDSWIDCSKIFPSIFRTFQRTDFPKSFFSKTASWRRHHPKNDFLEKTSSKNGFLEKTSSKKRLPGEDIIQKRLLGKEVIQKTTSWRT